MNDAPRRKGPLARALRRRLDGTQGLIIIDEADHLGAEALEELRLLQEATRVGLVMGNHRVYSNMTGGTRTVEFARLFSASPSAWPSIKPRKRMSRPLLMPGKSRAKRAPVLQRIAQKPRALASCHSLRLAAMTAHGAGEESNEAYILKAFRDLDLDVDISTLLRG
jgi:hypothetical protein